MRLKLSCREASRLLSEAQDGRLRLGERLTLRLHLGVCDACTRVAGQLAFLRRAMQAFPGPDAPGKDKGTG